MTIIASEKVVQRGEIINALKRTREKYVQTVEQKLRAYFERVSAEGRAVTVADLKKINIAFQRREGCNAQTRYVGDVDCRTNQVIWRRVEITAAILKAQFID